MMLPVHLTRNQIDLAIPRVADGLAKYQWLSQKFAENHQVHNNGDFQRRFNHFYRIRRGFAWQTVFYKLLGEARQNALQFSNVLELLSSAANRLEASYASKLTATIDTYSPVIDKFVLRNVGLALPAINTENRLAKTVMIYLKLKDEFNSYLQSQNGLYLVNKFNHRYPNSGITEIKMLDLLLWQTRD